MDRVVGYGRSRRRAGIDLPTFVFHRQGSPWQEIPLTPKTIKAFSILTWLEGAAVLAGLLSMTFNSGRGGIFDYTTLKWLLAAVLGLFLLAMLVYILGLYLRPSLGTGLSRWLERRLIGPAKRLFFVQPALIVLAVFLFEGFLLTYLAFPEPLRPFFLWGSLFCLQLWVFFRFAYWREYQQRPSMWARLRSKWAGWLPVQRKTFIILACLGLVYFAAFIPGNLQSDEAGNFIVHADEGILYADVTGGMVFPPTVSGFVHSALEAWPWQYGYPYFTASAAVLLIPRLIFGEQFATHVGLNLFLLRQLVNVVPMALAMALVVYLATRFKNLAASVAAFAFLALVPGSVKFNTRFWHPDALILLLVVLAIFALQKDGLRYGGYFYLAAAFCGLAAILKLWGLFFGPVVAGYLLAGWIQRRITFGKMLLVGGLFLLVMLAAILISSPSLMAPYIARVALRGWLPRQGSLLAGYAPDTTGEYDTGLLNWLNYFGFHYMKGYFFFFAIFALAAGSLWGSRVRLNRILLGWCAVTVIFLAYFVALKNFQYMLPVALPLYCGALLFPAVTEGPPGQKQPAFLVWPTTRRAVRRITLLLFGSQLGINLVILVLYAVRGR
jgi:hypothetical protein